MVLKQQGSTLTCRESIPDFSFFSIFYFPEILVIPLDLTGMAFILVLTFHNLASESDHYTSNLCLLHADKLSPEK